MENINQNIIFIADNGKEHIFVYRDDWYILQNKISGFFQYKKDLYRSDLYPDLKSCLNSLNNLMDFENCYDKEQKHKEGT